MDSGRRAQIFGHPIRHGCGRIWRLDGVVDHISWRIIGCGGLLEFRKVALQVVGRKNGAKARSGKEGVHAPTKAHCEAEELNGLEGLAVGFRDHFCAIGSCHWREILQGHSWS